MKILNNILAISLIVSSMLMVGCDDFLAERPEKSSNVVPETVEDMELVLGAYRSDEISHYILYGTDDVKPVLEIYNAKNNIYSIQDIQAATWESDLISKNYKDYLWKYRYENIFKSNMVLSILKKADISDSERERLTYQAKFKRAYNMFILADVYCLPYSEENLQEPGLPIKRSTAFDESVARVSLEETYAFIDEDIEEALKLEVELKDPIGVNSNYRGTKAGVYAFAARYYLAKNDYVNAQKYSQLALGEYGEDKLMDFTEWLDLPNEGYSPSSFESEIIIGNDTIDYEINYPPTYNNWDPTFWTESYFSASVDAGWGGIASWRYPSEDLINVYEEEGSKEEDLRWKYFFVEHYTYEKGCKYDYPAYFNNNRSTSVAEMLLIKAECQARIASWGDAMTTVNILRARRIHPDSENINLTASSKEEAIEKILEERRREMPFTMRLYDLRRLNNNDYAGDDVLVTKSFYPYNEINILDQQPLKTYTLEKKDRRYAAPIPDSEIISSKGVIKQNQY